MSENMLLNYEVLSTTTNVQSQIPQGVAMIGAPLEWGETKGKGIKVAVLDTGCPEHPDIKVKESAMFIKDNYSMHKYDRKGHSTHVCGTVAANGKVLGVAPEVDLYVGKVLNDIGAGSDDSISKGIDWAKECKVDIINMSLGGSSKLPKTYEAIKRAYTEGIFIACAAGNDPMAEVCYPARYDEVSAVAAVNLRKIAADFSSWGDALDIAALGTQVFSTWLDGKYALLDGTSMATPHIAGAAALFQAKAMLRYGRKLSVQELRLLFDIYAEDVMLPGKDVFTGFGVFSFGRFERAELPPIDMELTIGSKQYKVNNVTKTMDTTPVMDNNARTLVPVRFIAQELGCQVDFYAPKTIKIIRRGV
jgi:major intracellular serine protease